MKINFSQFKKCSQHNDICYNLLALTCGLNIFFHSTHSFSHVIVVARDSSDISQNYIEIFVHKVKEREKFFTQKYKKKNDTETNSSLVLYNRMLAWHLFECITHSSSHHISSKSKREEKISF